MKKSLFLLLPALLTATSCVDSLKEYSVDPKSASVAPGTTLISNAERSLARTMVSANTNEGPFRYYVQYWSATTYPQESRYDINTRAINLAIWQRLYRDVLIDLKEANRLITADVSITDPKIKANQLACGEVLSVYAWASLVDTFGDVPYSDALNPANPLPKYDDDKAIYNNLITRLDAAIGQMTTTSAGLGNDDLLNKGSMDLWKKFANSLKLRLAMTIADDDAAKAKTLVEAAVAGGVLTSNTDVIDLTFATNPNANPLWEDLVLSGRADFVGSVPFVDRLNALNDPRASSFFKLAADGTYKGAPYGASNSYDQFSAPGTKLEAPALPGVLMSYTQIEFLLADAADRGFAVGGTVASHYEAGVRASISEWGGTAAEADVYLAQPNVAFATALGATNKQKIGNQEWIALYNQPFDSFREYRRLDAPSLTKAISALSDIPVRLYYPVVEQNVNGANYSAASSAIGGDKVTTKVFWDKF